MKLLKHISITLALAVLLLQMAAPIILQLQQLYVQWQMLEALEEKELITITVDAADVQWIQTGKECVINGEMFDVKKSEEKNNQFLLTGLFDKKEKEIKAKIATQTKERHQTTGKLLKSFQLKSVTPSSPITIQFFTGVNANLFNKYKSSFYTSPFAGVKAPPPKYS